MLTQIPEKIDTALLLGWPLPMPADDCSKNTRGSVLIIGGSYQMPGSVILAANAALRAGAGKVTVATTARIAPFVALALPEARVLSLVETAQHGPDPAGAASLEPVLADVDTLLCGPGLQDAQSTPEFVLALLPYLGQCPIWLDALAMKALSHTAWTATRAKYALSTIGLTPHIGEMASLCQTNKSAIDSRRFAVAQEMAQQQAVMVVLKGHITCIAARDGRLWQHQGGNIGLAVSGSGDTLSGLIAGLTARGATVEQAAAWGVALHARAAEQLAARSGPLGYLPRDLLAEVPRLMHALRPHAL